MKGLKDNEAAEEEKECEQVVRIEIGGNHKSELLNSKWALCEFSQNFELKVSINSRVCAFTWNHMHFEKEQGE